MVWGRFRFSIITYFLGTEGITKDCESLGLCLTDLSSQGKVLVGELPAMFPDRQLMFDSKKKPKVIELHAKLRLQRAGCFGEPCSSKCDLGMNQQGSCTDDRISGLIVDLYCQHQKPAVHIHTQNQTYS